MSDVDCILCSVVQATMSMTCLTSRSRHGSSTMTNMWRKPQSPMFAASAPGLGTSSSTSASEWLPHLIAASVCHPQLKRRKDCSGGRGGQCFKTGLGLRGLWTQILVWELTSFSASLSLSDELSVWSLHWAKDRNMIHVGVHENFMAVGERWPRRTFSLVSWWWA